VGCESCYSGLMLFFFFLFFRQGLPMVMVSALTGGSFTVQVCNGHSSAALAGTLKVNFNLLQTG
jgi:hypothetical protein